MSQTTEAKKYNPFEEMGAEIEALPQMRRAAAPPQESESEIAPKDAAGNDIAIKRKRGTDKTVHQFTMRCRVVDSNKFVVWCDKHRISYREGFELLAAKIDDIKI